ncbi:MAG TPA: YcxB family protein [Verrucomicrobiae bacterium]|nr:YcxB family protein [Verrucomicrobiae bacterium]
MAGQLLYHRLTTGNKHIKTGLIWTASGIFLALVAVREKLVDLSPILLAGIGVWWVWAGIACFFPARYLRRAYAKQRLAGELYRADVNEDGFEVVGKFRSWRVQWPGVLLKGENQDMFVFFASNTIFIFGKKYLNLEQQAELRKFAALQTQQPATK